MPQAQNTSKPSAVFYNLDDLKNIPILSVCSHLSIPITRKYQKRAWCKIRQERTASTVLDLEKNTFCDYGSGEHGDVISFYAYAAGVSPGIAMQELGNAFGLSPKDPRAGLAPQELSHHEWSKLQIHGDRASKNFIFDVERMSVERLWELSEQYSMPMNQLRKEYPKTYERILRQKVLPYLRTLRNEYYLNVYGKHRLCMALKNPNLFSDSTIQQDLAKGREVLEQAERLFVKAVQGTSIRFTPEKSYAPELVLRQLLRGDHKLGTVSYSTMQARAREHNCLIKYRSVSYPDYQAADLSTLKHTAFLRGDQVLMGYLPSEEQQVSALLGAPMQAPPFRDKTDIQPAASCKQRESHER